MNLVLRVLAFATLLCLIAGSMLVLAAQKTVAPKKEVAAQHSPAPKRAEIAFTSDGVIAATQAHNKAVQ